MSERTYAQKTNEKVQKEISELFLEFDYLGFIGDRGLRDPDLNDPGRRADLRATLDILIEGSALMEQRARDLRFALTKCYPSDYPHPPE
jgi:hypothetical protein